MRLEFKFLMVFLMIIMVSMVSFQALAASPSDISVNTAPQNPSPGQSTSISLISYSMNLDSVLISWYVNGKKISSEIGLKSFTTVAPNAGVENTVRAVITTPDGNIEKKIVIKPSVMVLLWQATDSYVPPFYKGKAMPTANSSVRVVAIPETKTPSSLVYNWKFNYTNDAGSSGYGKNVFNYVNDYLENGDSVSVTASSINGTYASSADIYISASTPQLSFYKNDSSLGTIWEQALGNGHRIKGEETIVAAPYFISPKAIWSSSLVWNWYINGNLTNNTIDYMRNWLPITVEGEISGNSDIRLEVDSTNELFSTASRTLNVSF